MNDIAKETLPDIQSRILTVRGVQVMLDRDLAELYGVEVKRLNEQVSRNMERFPERFMHQLSWDEFADLKSQIATSSPVKSPMAQVTATGWRRRTSRSSMRSIRRWSSERAAASTTVS